MSKWINTGNDCFNLDKFIHIWIEKSVNGFFLMGEIENGEEIVLSSCFQCPLQCANYMSRITSN